MKQKIRSNKVKIRSRHPSHAVLRGVINTRLPVVVRFGSVKTMPNHYSINTAEAVRNSASKLLMKQCFKEHAVKTAAWCYPQNRDELEAFCAENISRDKKTPDKIIVKSLNGSRGKGLYLFNSAEECIQWFTDRRATNRNNYGMYIVEKYYNYTREYRLHLSADGCFYTCRKMLRSDITEDKRWYRNDSNSVWIIEENPAFDKPSNWDIVITEGVKALKAVGLHLGAIDLRIQSAKAENPDFIICEINSAPSFGAVTATKYKEEILKIVTEINQKHK